MTPKSVPDVGERNDASSAMRLAEALFGERPVSNRFKETNGKPKHTNVQ